MQLHVVEHPGISDKLHLTYTVYWDVLNLVVCGSMGMHNTSCLFCLLHVTQLHGGAQAPSVIDDDVFPGNLLVTLVENRH